MRQPDNTRISDCILKYDIGTIGVYDIVMYRYLYNYPIKIL